MIKNGERESGEKRTITNYEIRMKKNGNGERKTEYELRNADCE